MKTEWHSVGERLPNVGNHVLITDGKIICVGELSEFLGHYDWEAVGVSGYEWDWIFEGEVVGGVVTHWAELPELP